MSEIVYSFYTAWIIMLTILGTLFAAAKVTVHCIFVCVLQYLSGDPIKKNEIGRACGTYGRQERCIQVLMGDLREET
jgi:hypothetical protein